MMNFYGHLNANIDLNMQVDCDFRIGLFYNMDHLNKAISNKNTTKFYFNNCNINTTFVNSFKNYSLKNIHFLNPYIHYNSEDKIYIPPDINMLNSSILLNMCPQNISTLGQSQTQLTFCLDIDGFKIINSLCIQYPPCLRGTSECNYIFYFNEISGIL